MDRDEVAEWSPSRRRLPMRTKAVRKSEAMPIGELESLIGQQRTGDLKQAAELLETDPESLLLYHLGESGSDGLYPQLRAFLERRIAATIRGDFRFKDDQEARRFALRSRLLWVYFADCPQQETWFPDHWARAFMLRRYQDYLDAIAYSMWFQTKQRSERSQSMKRRLKEDPKSERIRELALFAGDVKVQDYVRSYTQWRMKTSPLGGRSTPLTESAVHKAKSRGQEIWQRGGWLPILIEMPGDHKRIHPTSLHSVQSLGGTDYREIWHLRDPKKPQQIREARWITLRELASSEMDHEDRIFVNLVRDTLKVHSYVSGRIFGPAPHQLCLGPYFNRSTPKRHAQRLRERGLALGDVFTSPVSMTFYRPASPDQWTA